MMLHIPELSDELRTAHVVADPPRKRDWWKVLRGKWEPTPRLVYHLTLKGTDEMLKKHYTEEIQDQLNRPSPFLR